MIRFASEETRAAAHCVLHTYPNSRLTFPPFQYIPVTTTLFPISPPPLILVHIVDTLLTFSTVPLHLPSLNIFSLAHLLLPVRSHGRFTPAVAWDRRRSAGYPRHPPHTRQTVRPNPHHSSCLPRRRQSMTATCSKSALLTAQSSPHTTLGNARSPAHHPSRCLLPHRMLPAPFPTPYHVLAPLYLLPTIHALLPFIPRPNPLARTWSRLVRWYSI